jgi:hypothetical protein
VLAAVENVTDDAKSISEMRATKAGAKISKARMAKLRQVMAQLEALMMEVEPAQTSKSADDISLTHLAAQMEFQKLMQLGIK